MESEAITPNKNKRVSDQTKIACAVCKKAHVFCSADRPCSRCISKGIPNECVDPVFKKRGRVPKEQSLNQLLSTAPTEVSNSTIPAMETIPPQISETMNVLTDDLLHQLFQMSPLPQYLIQDSPDGLSLDEADTLQWKRIKESPHFHHYFTVEGEDIATPSNTSYRDFHGSIHDLNLSDKRWKAIGEYAMATLDQRSAHSRKNMTKKQALDSFLLFETTLKKIEDAFEIVDTPVIVSEKTGLIHYVNGSFRLLTGFDSAVPSKTREPGWYHLLAEDTFLRMALLLISLEEAKDSCSIIVPGEMYCYGKLVDVYLTVSTKKDERGESLMMITTVQLKVEQEMPMSQLSLTAKQLAFKKKFDSLK